MRARFRNWCAWQEEGTVVHPRSQGSKPAAAGALLLSSVERRKGEEKKRLQEAQKGRCVWRNPCVWGYAYEHAWVNKKGGGRRGERGIWQAPPPLHIRTMWFLLFTKEMKITGRASRCAHCAIPKNKSRQDNLNSNQNTALFFSWKEKKRIFPTDLPRLCSLFSLCGWLLLLLRALEKWFPSLVSWLGLPNTKRRGWSQGDFPPFSPDIISHIQSPPFFQVWYHRRRAKKKGWEIIWLESRRGWNNCDWRKKHSCHLLYFDNSFDFRARKINFPSFFCVCAFIKISPPRCRRRCVSDRRKKTILLSLFFLLFFGGGKIGKGKGKGRKID